MIAFLNRYESFRWVIYHCEVRDGGIVISAINLEFIICEDVVKTSDTYIHIYIFIVYNRQNWIIFSYNFLTVYTIFPKEHDANRKMG